MQEPVEKFIKRWEGVEGSELSTSQSFIIELCGLLGVGTPHPKSEEPGSYMFERPLTLTLADGTTRARRIDCYKRGHFILESKKLNSGQHTKGFDNGLIKAHAQASDYVRALPAVEGRPPFILVVDVGTVIQVYSEFSKTGGVYTPYPDSSSFRIPLKDLVKEEVRQLLHGIWTNPDALDPSRISAKVTRDVAALLAQLAKSLETEHSAEVVASYLTRSLFSMFAEDVELLPKGSYIGLLEAHKKDPTTLQNMLRALWADMDRGGFSGAIAQKVLRFNGKLFKGAENDNYSLLLTTAQVELLIKAAKANWREVEPAIFGTLLERALDPTERHTLGAHYTPRAYVERLVIPTVIQPLREDWENAKAAALVLAHEAEQLSGKDRDKKLAEARAEVTKFLHQLSTTTVLDPACGSGNFLYVTLEHLKRLEGEVMNLLEDLGHTQEQLGFAGETVTLQQLRGIELNERAAALAELVLWIGYLQWHIRTRGHASVAEPVVHNYGNIECRDAVLAWDSAEPAHDANGQPLSRWDGRTYITSATTGEPIPDPAARVPQLRYTGVRQPEWPRADFIVGNPPFIGASTMRDALGDGYVEALRKTWVDVPDSADFVMFWWHHAAMQVAQCHTRRMGLITTNSLRQTLNRRVVQAALAKDTHLTFAIPDHPWVDSANGAAVRIAMTALAHGPGEGGLQTVANESSGHDGEVIVTLLDKRGTIHEDLSIGANVANASTLGALKGLSNRGFELGNAGFIVTQTQASELGAPELIHPYLNGKDLTGTSRNVCVIDAYGMTSEELRSQYPSVYQHLQNHVKPERDVNRDAKLREKWWLHRRLREDLRGALKGLPRYIATVETTKHRTFQFLDAGIVPDNMLIAIAVDDAFVLGVLSSQVHIQWALATGSRLGVGNDPRYNKTRCFETFPFPDQDTGMTPALSQKIGQLAESIDAHRKRVLGAGHKGLTLTGLYNVLEALREGRALTAKEKTINTQGVVGVLRELHDELDAAVLQAYGLPANADTDAVLHHLVALNSQRAAEEVAGKVRWLRPEFQNAEHQSSDATKPSSDEAEADEATDAAAKSKPKKGGKASAKVEQQAWPASLPEQVRAVTEVIASSTGALDTEAIAAHFKARGAWKKGLATILQILEATGRVYASEVNGVTTWALAKH